MKKKGFSVLWVAIALLIVGFGALVTYAIMNKDEQKQQDEAKEAALLEHVNSLDLYTILTPSNQNGQMGDNVYGPEDAPVTIYEYADYQCEYCAMTFPYVSQLVEEYKGKVKLVYRGMVLDYHKNGNSAASAANAAALQGYWHEYALALFKHQESWKKLTGSSLQTSYEEYFRIASNTNGDMDKFREDKDSERVQQKIAFDGAICKAMEIKATPTIYVEDENVVYESVDEQEFKDTFRAVIDRKLAEKK